MNTSEDPVVRRRAVIDQRANLVRRVGYALWAGAMAIFFVGFATTFTPGKSQVIIGLLIAGSVLLLPAIIVGYGVKAAVREENRTRGTGTGQSRGTH